MKKATLILIFLFVGASQALAFDGMRLRVRTDLPMEIKTVGEAAQYFAANTGYRLIIHYPAPTESGRIANEPIMLATTAKKVLPVEDAILTLLADNYRLVVDRKHKLFSFEERTPHHD